MEAPSTFVFERNNQQIIMGPMCFQSGMQGMDPSLLKFTRGTKVLGVEPYNMPEGSGDSSPYKIQKEKKERNVASVYVPLSVFKTNDKLF